MKLISLEINDFRGLNFVHSFSDDKFIVLTGVNGSGKSTIIDVIELLLKTQSSGINESIVNQITSTKAELEIEIESEPGEIEYLAKKLYSDVNNNITVEEIKNTIGTDVFVSNRYKRKLIIERPILGWSPNANYVVEFINGNEVSVDTDRVSISNRMFNLLAAEVLIKFDQLESINLSFNQISNTSFTIQNIFQNTQDNPGQRLNRTSFNISPLVNSLITYEYKGSERLDELIDELSTVLDPLKIKSVEQANGLYNLALVKDKSTFTIDTASSGQKRAVVLVALKFMLPLSEFKPIILLDEPENSMHPGLTSKIFKSLNSLASSESQPSILIATHSAEVVEANLKNTYRIVHSSEAATLKKVIDLETRAQVLNELGVNFHMDYVAQKIIFVESEHKPAAQELQDSEAYQILLDPNKERILFISAGSKAAVRQQFKFQNTLLKELKVNSGSFIEHMTDRDDESSNDNNTEYRNVEYLYVYNKELLKRVVEKHISKKIRQEVLDSVYTSFGDIANCDPKKLWTALCSRLGIKKVKRIPIQTEILQEIRSNKENRDQIVSNLFSRW